MITKDQISKMVEDNRQEILDCMVEVLKTPSPTGYEAECGTVFAKWIKKAGLEAKIYEAESGRPNVFGEWFGSQPGKRFIFNGHMDHFPPPEYAEDTYGPYSGMIANGCVYGRGASDMRSGDVSALMAVTLLKRMGFDPKGSVLLSYMCDEENGSTLGAKWCIKQGLLEGDVGICMEATQKQLWIKHGGIWRVWITYTSMGANSLREHPTQSALQKGVKAINALYELAAVVRQRVDEDGDTPSLSISTIHAGHATNVHASKCRFCIDRRTTVNESRKEAAQEILNLLDSLKASDPEMDYSYEIISDRPSMNLSREEPFIKTCAEAYKELSGKDVEYFFCHAGSDASNIHEHNGIIMPNWSGATGGMASKKDERINIEDMLFAIKCYMLTMVKTLS